MVRWKGVNCTTKKGGDSGPPFDGDDANEGVSPISLSGATSFIITGLVDNTTYHFSLIACESDFNDIITVFPVENQQEHINIILNIINTCLILNEDE